jgi:DNA polymerase I-like protein with 3'-5' exonuclease and polymerase domains
MSAYEVVRSADRLQAVAADIEAAEVISFDLETTGLSPHTSQIRILSLNTGNRVYVIDAFQTQTLEPVIEALRVSRGVKLGHNLKFDQKFLLHFYGLELWPVFDTYRASCLIYNGKFSGKGTQDLYALYARELQIGPEAPDLGGSDWSAPVLTQSQLDYAAEDVIHLPKLRACLKPKLAEHHLNSVAMIEFRAILPEAAMELAGFHFDQTSWLALAEENALQAKRLQRELLHELPHPANQLALPGFDPDFNLSSPAQLLKALQMVGLDIENTSEITLAMFAKEFPIVKKILNWRGYSQAVKTFGPDYLKHVNSATNRIHTNYYPYTGAGRYASSDPNLQQIPRPLKPRRQPCEFRECFRAPPGKKLVLADYSQIELRIAAELAEDQTLMGVYIRGEDAHAQTASLVAHCPLDQVTKDQRQMAKAVNFGLIYGMAAPKLVQYAQANYGVSMSLDEAELFRTRYFEAYSGIKSWHGQIFSDYNKRKGVTRTVAGRLRYLQPDAHNEWANTPVQGTGADGLKCSLAVVYRRLKKYNGAARMIHMVHDEIILEVDEAPELVAAVQKDLEEGMIEGMQPLLRKVPVVVEGGSGDTWAAK